MDKWDGASGMITPADVELIGQLVGMLPDVRDVLVMDLGAGSGTTALSVFKARSQAIHVSSVDVQRSALEATQANMAQYGFLDRWKGHNSRSDALGRGWIGNSVDLLLCDSTHDYASQMDELEAWLPHVRAGGLVWIHDASGYGREIYPGVRLAIDELVAQGRLTMIAEAGYGWAGAVA